MFRKIRKNIIIFFFKTLESFIFNHKIIHEPTHKLKIKYYSQHSPSVSHYWQPRICALACINMIFSIKNNDTNLNKLISLGIKYNGYNTKTDKGWYHMALVNILSQHKFKAKITKILTLNKIINVLSSQKIIIASVKSNNNIDHMILITSFEINKNKRLAKLYLFDPLKPNPTNNNEPIKLSFQKFLKISNYRGVIVD